MSVGPFPTSAYAMLILPADRQNEISCLCAKADDRAGIPACSFRSSMLPTDTAVEGGIRDDATAPYRRNEVVLADDAITVFDQVDQKVEYLRLDWTLAI
jgi:hypothetical protein